MQFIAFPLKRSRYNKTWGQLPFFLSFFLKFYLLFGFYCSLEDVKNAKRRVAVSKLFLCAYVFYIIANYDSWVPSEADLFLKSAFRCVFSTEELIHSFSIFLKLKTFTLHGNSCASWQEGVSLFYHLAYWQSKEVPVMLMGSSVSVLKMDSSSRRSLAAFLMWECQTTNRMALKLPDSKGISFLTTQWGLCSQSIQLRGRIKPWAWATLCLLQCFSYRAVWFPRYFYSPPSSSSTKRLG